MKRLFILCLLGCLLLTGCGPSNSYLSVRPHTEAPTVQTETAEETTTIVTNRTELRGAVLSFIRSWVEDGLLLVREYEGDIGTDLTEAMRYACQEEPIGAYAVDYADAELEGDASQGVIHISIVFRRSAAEIASIVTVSDSSAAKEMILEALENYETALTLRIRSYTDQDHSALIYNYCLEHPETMVAIPVVSEAVYPREGDTRILELHFDYPESRDELARRRQALNTILSSAASYINKGSTPEERLTLLHRFLTNRFTYTHGTELPRMPAYSLLCQGQAHSLSFAIVVRAQCRTAGIDCLLVSGTRNGVAHYWNIVTLDGIYYHLDLQRAVELGETELLLLEQTDVLREEGYVWDAAAYPANPEPEPTEPPAPPEPTESEPSTEPPAPTESTPAESTASTEPTEDSSEEPGAREEPTESEGPQ